MSADYYNITVNDRVLFSDQTGVGNFAGTALGDALASSNIKAFKFFINTVDSKTSGLDLVLNIDNINIGDNGNDFDIVLAANFNNTNLDGGVEAPAVFGNVSIFGDLPSRLLTSARPDAKTKLDMNFDLADVGLNFNYTYFGSVNSPVSNQQFSGTVITDIMVSYSLPENFMLTASVNNLFDIFPDRIDGNLDPFGWRLHYPWRVSQFGFMGRYLKAGATFNS